MTPGTTTPSARGSWRERLEDLAGRLRSVEGFPESLAAFLELAAAIEPFALEERRADLECAAGELDDVALAIGLTDLPPIGEAYLASGLEEDAAGIELLLEVLRTRHGQDQDLRDELPEIFGQSWRDELGDAAEFFAREVGEPAIARLLEVLARLEPGEIRAAVEEGGELHQVLAELETEQLPGLAVVLAAIAVDPRFRHPEAGIALDLARGAVRAELTGRSVEEGPP